ncbi:MAG TPA: hypothetical protein VGN37_27295 [Actinocatenispora sp.]
MRSLCSADGVWRVHIDTRGLEYGGLRGMSFRIYRGSVLVAESETVRDALKALPAGIRLRFDDTEPTPGADGVTVPGRPTANGIPAPRPPAPLRRSHRRRPLRPSARR